METTLTTPAFGLRLLPWVALSGIFWLLGILWLQFLYHASDDPGVGFAMFLLVVLANFVVLAYGLPLIPRRGWQRQASALSFGAFVFILWAGAGICFVRYVS